MALYEANYIKLAQLIPDLSRRSGSAVSAGHEDCSLHLTIESQTRYTCELRLTYLFADELGSGEFIADPDLVATIYFDARLAEVSSWLDHRLGPRQHAVLRDLRLACAGELDHRWRRNIMLRKWLDYLQECGHYFPAADDLSG